MKKSILVIVSFVIGIQAIAYMLGACTKNENPNGLTMVSISIPDGFPAPKYYFGDNPMSLEGIELGRQLFYDGRLSKDGFYPCSSCHQQIAGFGTFEHDRSHGYNGSHTLRNAPVLFNLNWQTRFHWDGEFTTMYHQAAQPINSPIEMAETFNGIIDKLNKDPKYRKEFKEVFRTDFISPEYMLKALAQFTGSLVSANSRYDRHLKGTVNFTPEEENGYQLFKAKCASCHPEPMFTDYAFHNIGLPVDNFLNDYGVLRITHESKDSLLFKTPTLRNVFISSNYMHDGRFNTLAQCFNHYRTGVQQSATLDPQLAGGIAMSDADAINIGLFLRTLTDSSFLLNPKLAKP